MTVTLEVIQAQLTDILDILDRRIGNITIAPNQLRTSSGLSDIDTRLGLVQSGEFRSGNGQIPGDGFTGGRFGYPGFLYNDELWMLAGVENDVLKVGINLEDGKLYAEEAVISGTLTVGTGSVIAGWEITSTEITKTTTNVGISIDSSVPAIYVGDLAGDHIVIDGANQRIRSSNYVAGASGFNIDSDTGDAEFNNIVARGMIKTAVFQKDTISSVGGTVVVLQSEALALDMGPTDGSDLYLAEDVLNIGDILRMKDGVDDEWMLVDDVDIDLGLFRYTVLRDRAGVYASGANPAWKKGQAVVNYGQSGDGGIELVAGATPAMNVFDHSGSPWSSLRQIVVIDEQGIIFDNLSDVIRFKDSTGVYDGTHGTAMYGEAADDSFAIVNRKAGKALQFFIKLTDASTPYLKWYEHPSEANTAKLEINAGSTSTQVVIANDIYLSTNKDGATTIFNERSSDIDFRIESAANSNAFFLDAGNEAIHFFGSSGGSSLLTVDDGTDKRLEIGADHYFPRRDASNPNGFWNEANQDMDFTFESVNQSALLKLDAGADKSTSFNWDGWSKRDETWTRTGDHSFTVSGDRTAIYRKGTKVRYNDGATDYGVIGASSHAAGTTTITLITTSSYAMAATTITDTYLSYIENPEGFPTSFGFTQSYTGFSVNPTQTITWTTVGNRLFLGIQTLANGTSNATTFTMSLPITVAVNAIDFANVRDNGTEKLGVGYAAGTTSTLTYYNGTFGTAFTNSGSKGGSMVLSYAF